MPRDVDAPLEGGGNAIIRLRLDRFELMTRVVGATTSTARAQLIGVDRKTIYRALEEGTIGEVFMAQTVAALRRHGEALAACGLTPSLDELFEVVETDAMAEAVA